MDDTQKQITDLQNALAELQELYDQHQHNGFDASDINFQDIALKILPIHHAIYGADAATAANYGVFWVAPFPCYLFSAREVHATAGSSGAAVTLNIEKLTGTQAAGSGVNMLSTELSLKATANTVQTGAITTTVANRNLAIGDRLCMKDTGTLTAVADVCVSLQIMMV